MLVLTRKQSRDERTTMSTNSPCPDSKKARRKKGPTTPDPDAMVYREEQAARLLGVAQKTLRRRRREGTGPQYFVSGSMFFYSRGALERWIAKKEQETAGGRG